MQGMLVIYIKRILFRALISLNLFYILFVGLDDAKDVNDSVSSEMSSSKYAGSQWLWELANEHTTLRTLDCLVYFDTHFDSHRLVLLETHFSYGILSLLLHNVHILLLSNL